MTPTRFFAFTCPFKILWILPTGNCRPALVDLDWGALLPFPALPPLPPFPPFPLGYKNNLSKNYLLTIFYFRNLFNKGNNPYIIKLSRIILLILLDIQRDDEKEESQNKCQK